MNSTVSLTRFPLTVSNSKHYLLLFVVWPFLAFLTAIYNYNQKEARKVVYFFLIYYGLNLVIGNTGMDSERYAFGLLKTAELPFSDFFMVLGGLYSDTSVDIVEPLVTFIVSRFTRNPGVLFAVWTAIMGFFYIKSINLLYVRYIESPEWKVLVILVFFILASPITTVTGVRMPIATWMFFYGTYHIVLYRDARFFFLTLSAPLVHWSFLTANAVLILYFFIGNRNLIYVPLVFLSFILPQILAPVFKSLALGFGGAIQSRYEGYSNEDYILGIQESYDDAAWFLTLSENLLFYYILLCIILIQLGSKNVEKEREDRNMFSFLLLFLAFVNFGKVIPTFGGRFQAVFILFATVYIFIRLIKMRNLLARFLIWLGIFPMALYAAVNFRVGSDTISAWIFTPGMGLSLLAPTLSLADILFH